MSFDKVKQFFESHGAGDKVLWLEHSSATVELAAEAVGCEPARIAKTLSFLVGEQPILILTAGDVKVDNKKYKELFHTKAKMIPGDIKLESAACRSHNHFRLIYFLCVCYNVSFLKRIPIFYRDF